MSTLRHPRQLFLQLSTALLASLLLVVAGQVAAQSATGSATKTANQQTAGQQTAGQVDQVKTGAATQNAAEAAELKTTQADDQADRKPADKRKRIKAQEPERELEEEEDI